MKGEGSNDFDINELDNKIREQKNIVSKKEDSQNLIKKNPKASLAIASIVFAALVIGMIATFGGVGMIDGVLLGKVVLTAVTAGTAAFGAKKLYDTVKGDKDKNQLRKLEKTRDSFNRRKTEEIARAAKLELANLKEQARDRDKVDMVMGEGWEDIGDGNFKKKGYIYGQREELNDDQMALYDKTIKQRNLKNAKMDASEVTKELERAHDNLLEVNIKLLSTKLGMHDADSKNPKDLVKLLDADVKKSDGSPLDDSGSTNKDLLKEILRAGLGINSGGTVKISQASSDFIDPQGRIAILKGLNDALDTPTGGSNPKFSNVDPSKDVSTTLKDLKKLVDKEKQRMQTKASKKSVGK